MKAIMILLLPIFSWADMTVNFSGAESISHDIQQKIFTRNAQASKNSPDFRFKNGAIVAKQDEGDTIFLATCTLAPLNWPTEAHAGLIYKNGQLSTPYLKVKKGDRIECYAYQANRMALALTLKDAVMSVMRLK